MSESHVCPECGARLAADAPEGLCPKCLLRAAAWESQAGNTEVHDEAVEDRVTDFGWLPRERAASAPSAPVEVDQFKRALLELGLVSASEFDRFVAGPLKDVQGVAQALLAAGKLTRYQAAALAQGKGRGLLIGNYLILEKLRAGGMGVVFKARHRRLGRIVALKILPPSLARDKTLLSRFRREVDVAAKLSHPNIVSILDADEYRGVQFMTMEYIEGTDLDHLVQESGVLPVDLALDCTIQAARGLEAAHAQGIVHRDIKPANMMLDESGVVRVLDLGLARLVEASNPFGETATGPLTRTGTSMGTVDFMAPEQGIDSRSVDHRADIYSLGCTLCYLLTARVPFEGTNVLKRMMAHQDRAPASLLAMRGDVPKAVDAVYQHMMAKNAADRPASMTEVVRLLEACRSRSVAAGDVRSESREFAKAARFQRAAPGESGSDVSPFPRENAFEHSGGADMQREDAMAHRGGQQCPTQPKLPPANSESIPLRNETAPKLAPRPHKSRTPLYAVGALAVVVLGALGSSLLWRNTDRSRGDRVPPASREKSSGGDPVSATVPGRPAPARIASPSPGTFDVATLHAAYDQEWRALSVTADGHHALVGGRTTFPERLNVDKGQVEHNFGWHYNTISDAAMTPEGRHALIATYNVGKKSGLKERGTLWFWDVKTGKALFPMQQPHESHVTAVAISADGRRGLSAGRFGDLLVWDLTTGKSVALGQQQGEVMAHAMAFFPDGRHAATGGRDKVVHLWDVDERREVATWTAHDMTISGLAISADGRRMVTGSFDGTVILWDAGNGAMLHRFDMPPGDKGAHVAFDPEGHIVAAGYGTNGNPPTPGNLLVWDADTHALLRRDEKPFARHLALATLPGGRVLTGDDYAIRIWTPRAAGSGAIEPPSSANKHVGPVDLLALVAREPHKSSGKWETPHGELHSPPTRWASLEIPYVTPPDYRIDMKVELVGKESDRPIGLGLLVDGRRTVIAIDKVLVRDGRQAKGLETNGRYSGLNDVDGVPLPFGPHPHHGQLLFPSRPVKLSVIVGPTSIRMTCDGSSVVDWKGDARSLIPHAQGKSFGTGYPFLYSNTSVVIHQMTLTPLDPASR
jgi:serine/threonine protein kinase/WD40 repeat protein